MAKHEILDISGTYTDLISDLTYIEAGLQSLLYNEILVFFNKYGIDTNDIWVEEWECDSGRCTTDSTVNFVFSFDNACEYRSYKDICLRVIYKGFKNSTGVKLRQCLYDLFGIENKSLDIISDKEYRDRNGLYSGVLYFRDFSIADIKRLKGIVENGKKFKQGKWYLDSFSKDELLRILCNMSDGYFYNRVLEHLMGDLHSCKAYLVKIMNRGTLNPTVYIGRSDTDIDMTKYRILKYIPAERIEIAKMHNTRMADYRIKLKMTENEFLAIFHDIYVEWMNNKKSIDDIEGINII